IPCPEFPARHEERVRAAIQPEATGLERAGGSRGVATPVPCVYLPVSLTAPGPSGSTGPTRLCRGCSRPHRRPPAQTSSIFTPPLRRQRNGGLAPPSETCSASWRTVRQLEQLIRPGGKAAVQLAAETAQPLQRPVSWIRAPALDRVLRPRHTERHGHCLHLRVPLKAPEDDPAVAVCRHGDTPDKIGDLGRP